MGRSAFDTRIFFRPFYMIWRGQRSHFVLFDPRTLMLTPFRRKIRSTQLNFLKSSNAQTQRTRRYGLLVLSVHAIAMALSVTLFRLTWLWFKTSSNLTRCVVPLSLLSPIFPKRNDSEGNLKLSRFLQDVDGDGKLAYDELDLCLLG